MLTCNPETQNCISTCKENDPNDNAGTCSCFTYGPDTMLQDEIEFDTLDGTPPHRDALSYST